MSEIAKVPPLEPTGGSFRLPSHLLDFKPSIAGEEVFASVLGPFKQLVEENIVLLAAVVGLSVCLAVGYFAIKFVGGRGGSVSPASEGESNGNVVNAFGNPGGQGVLF